MGRRTAGMWNSWNSAHLGSRCLQDEDLVTKPSHWTLKNCLAFMRFNKLNFQVLEIVDRSLFQRLSLSLYVNLLSKFNHRFFICKCSIQYISIRGKVAYYIKHQIHILISIGLIQNTSGQGIMHIYVRMHICVNCCVLFSFG